MHDPDVRGAVEVVVALLGALTLIAFVVRWVRLPLSVALVSFGLLVAAIAPARFTISPDVVLTALVPGLVFEAALRLHLADLLRSCPVIPRTSQGDERRVPAPLMRILRPRGKRRRSLPVLVEHFPGPRSETGESGLRAPAWLLPAGRRQLLADDEL